MLQSLATDAVVLLAAAWLVWSFAPSGFRKLFVKKPAPAYDVALQADELSGQSPGDTDCACRDKA